jgi:hypothetical protein
LMPGPTISQMTERFARDITIKNDPAIAKHSPGRLNIKPIGP